MDKRYPSPLVIHNLSPLTLSLMQKGRMTIYYLPHHYGIVLAKGTADVGSGFCKVCEMKKRGNLIAELTLLSSWLSEYREAGNLSRVPANMAEYG